MSTWIFQSNPTLFRLDDYLATFNEIDWAVNQEHYSDQICAGDCVFVWRSDGRVKGSGGIVAQAFVVARPTLRDESEDAKPFWIDQTGISRRLRVRLRITKVADANKILKRSSLLNDPIVGDMHIIKAANSTNFLLTRAQESRIKTLWETFESDWSEEEQCILLWGFLNADQYGNPSAWAKTVAKLIPRTLPSITMRFANFSHVKSGDGLSKVAPKDIDFWNKYLTNAARESLFGMAEQWVISRGYEIEKESSTRVPILVSPDDDPEVYEDVRRRRRRRQSEFRSKLLRIYNGRCAITNEGIECILEAAHILDHAQSGVNDLSNGIILRSDIHELFDAGLILINPTTMTVEIHESLQRTSYAIFSGRSLAMRSDGSQLSDLYLQLRYKR